MIDLTGRAIVLTRLTKLFAALRPHLLNLATRRLPASTWATWLATLKAAFGIALNRA